MGAAAGGGGVLCGIMPGLSAPLPDLFLRRRRFPATSSSQGFGLPENPAGLPHAWQDAPVFHGLMPPGPEERHPGLGVASPKGSGHCDARCPARQPRSPLKKRARRRMRGCGLVGNKIPIVRNKIHRISGLLFPSDGGTEGAIGLPERMDCRSSQSIIKTVVNCSRPQGGAVNFCETLPAGLPPRKAHHLLKPLGPIRRLRLLPVCRRARCAERAGRGEGFDAGGPQQPSPPSCSWRPDAVAEGEGAGAGGRPFPRAPNRMPGSLPGRPPGRPERSWSGSRPPRPGSR